MHVQSTRAHEVEGPTWAELHILLTSIGLTCRVIALVSSYYKSLAVNCGISIIMSQWIWIKDCVVHPLDTFCNAWNEPNSFLGGALPRTPLRYLTTLLRLPSRLGRATFVSMPKMSVLSCFMPHPIVTSRTSKSFPHAWCGKSFRNNIQLRINRIQMLS